MQGILETLHAKKELRVFEFIARGLGNDYSHSIFKVWTAAYEDTLETLAKSLAGMPRLNQLTLNFCKHLPLRDIYVF